MFYICSVIKQNKVMDKIYKIADRLEKYMESEDFEKKSEKVMWWIVGFSFCYFTARIILSVVWNI